MTSAQALSSPSKGVKENNLVELSGAIFMIKFWSVRKNCEKIIETRKHENTDRAMEVSDYEIVFQMGFYSFVILQIFAR